MFIFIGIGLQAARKVCWLVHMQLILLACSCSSKRGRFNLHSVSLAGFLKQPNSLGVDDDDEVKNWDTPSQNVCVNFMWPQSQKAEFLQR